MKFKKDYEISVEIVIDVSHYRPGTPDVLGNPEFARQGDPEECDYTISMVGKDGVKVLAPDFLYNELHDDIMEDIRDKLQDEEQDAHEQKMEAIRERIYED